MGLQHAVVVVSFFVALWLSGCASEPAPTPVEDPVARLKSEFRRASSIEIKQRCLEALCSGLEARLAFREVIPLVDTLALDPAASARADEVVRSVGNALFPGFREAPELFEDAFVHFEIGSGTLGRRLGWLLASSGAAQFLYELDALRIEKAWPSLEDASLRRLVLGNLGQCRDKETVLGILRSVIVSTPATETMQFPALTAALPGYRSVLAGEDYLRSLFEGGAPRGHPVTSLYTDVLEVPDSRPQIEAELVDLARNRKLTPFDVSELCSFFAEYSPRSILLLDEEDVRYHDGSTTRILRDWARKVRPSRRRP